MEERKNIRPLLVAAVVAVLLHLELIFSGVLISVWEFWGRLLPRPPPAESVTEISLVQFTPAEWAQNQKIRPPVQEDEKERARPQPPPEEEKKEENLKGQVVDVAPTPDNRPPEEYRYLSEHNTRVEKESVSRHQRPDYGIAQPRPTVADWQKNKSDQATDNKEKQMVAVLEKKTGSRGPSASRPAEILELPDVPQRQPLQLKLDTSLGSFGRYFPSEELKGNGERLRLRIGESERQSEEGDEGQDQHTVAAFQAPSLQNLDMMSGAPANDHLQDIPKGEETLLNSREFKYATFFNRVKRSVSEHWRPAEVYLRHDPYGNVYGVKDRFTLVSVRLDGEGRLDDISVSRSSGIDFLDDEAVRAFRSAAPFPNPPQGLVESDGKIRFQFGFYFEIGERPVIRAFRMRGLDY